MENLKDSATINQKTMEILTSFALRVTLRKKTKGLILVMETSMTLQKFMRKLLVLEDMKFPLCGININDIFSFYYYQ